MASVAYAEQIRLWPRPGRISQREGDDMSSDNTASRAAITHIQELYYDLISAGASKAVHRLFTDRSQLITPWR
jgi:hypothetical protein